MVKIRLRRIGTKKRPFYRIVLTEHAKPADSGYKEVLGRFDPLQHTMEVDVDTVKSWISK
ncbi:MAG: 30S ribosomal protein S16 [Candidatus Omnitrophica bacterium]|nr:30S ribosomal protein S16 [Candidatus Omnitrophota bacterium]